MANQGVLTVVTEIDPGRMDALANVLRRLDTALDDSTAQPLVDFCALGSVHFARFAILPADAAGKRHLLFSSAFDGPRRFHLTELAKRARAGLCEIFAHCVGFPPEARTAPATLIAFLERHSVRHGAMHVGYVGRTVADVKAERDLRVFIQARLDAAKVGTLPTGDRPATALRDAIVGWVRTSDFRWALEPRAGRIERSSVDGFWRSALFSGGAAIALVGGGCASFAVGNVVGLSVYVGAVLGAAGLVVATLRWHETHEPAKTDTDVEEKDREHAGDEDFGIRNQLTHIVDVKPGAFRRALLRAVLFAVEWRARFEFHRGDLGGIETIHCAHWAIVQGDRADRPRLLFCSNYTGSWERYLGDFIEEAGGGMTSVWSNTVNYPRARYLLLDGAMNERVFKAWTRQYQVHTDVWYAAVPDQSVRNLNDNSRLRDGLREPMTEAEAREWLRLL